jgi:hypothetical protein
MPLRYYHDYQKVAHVPCCLPDRPGLTDAYSMILDAIDTGIYRPGDRLEAGWRASGGVAHADP